MDELEPRVRAVCDLNVAEAREYGGRHEYDGVPQDLSPDGVAAGLARLAAARQGRPAAERPARRGAPARRSRTCSGWSTPTWSCTGATRCTTSASSTSPATTRTTRPRRSGTRPGPRTWPPGPRSSTRRSARSTRCPPPVAASLLGGIRGLAAGIPADADPRRAGRGAGRAPAAGRARGAGRGRRAGRRRARAGRAGRAARPPPRRSTVDLGALAARADAERDRLRARLDGVGRADRPEAAAPWTWRGNWSRTTRTGRA